MVWIWWIPWLFGLFCFFLALIGWILFKQKYHPARVLTLIYQPFALLTMGVLASKEAKIDTRKRNLTGFVLFFLSTLALLVVNSSALFPYYLSVVILFPASVWFVSLIWQLDLASKGKGGIGNYIGICAIVAVFGIADAHIEGGLVGDLSFMCPEFIQVNF